MSAAEARALCGNLICIESDPAGDRRLLDALGRWLIRFTPLVALAEHGEDEPPPAALLLDLSGCERLFGGIHALVDRIEQSLICFGIPTRIAIAPTVGAAWAFAMSGMGRLIEPDSFLRHLAHLPITSLRLSDDILSNLHHLGLHHVGNLLALPREQLPSRFGALLLKRIDQLTDVLAEPLIKLVNDPPIIARMEFDAAIESPEDIDRIFERLLCLILSDLTSRNHGVRQLRMILKPDRGWDRPVLTRSISLSRPHRDRATLLNLIRCEIERIDCEHGFIRFQLDVPLHETTHDSQTQLFDQEMIESEMELERLLQRLRARLGEPSVIRPELVASYLPERAWRAEQSKPSASLSTVLPPRPLCLFTMPIEIGVVCEPSDDRTGHPRQFSWRGHAYRLMQIVGPERISGEWWRGHHRTRDYYDVEDEHGLRFWIFRVVHAAGEQLIARWFLHGRFE